MDDKDTWALRNVLVMALADGKVTDEENRFISRLRQRLDIDAVQFKQLCQEVRAEPKRVKLPSDPAEAEKALRLLVDVAAADGEITSVERRGLQRMGQHIGISPGALEAIMAGVASDADQRLGGLTEEVYENFANWDEAQRREKLALFAQSGHSGVLLLLRMLESYRAPNDDTDALAMKVMIIEQLAAMGKPQAVYYLAQQVALTGTDEVTSPELRAAAAEAIGQIVGQPMPRDQAGVDAAREWWGSAGLAQYNTLAF